MLIPELKLKLSVDDYVPILLSVYTKVFVIQPLDENASEFLFF